MDRCGRTGLQRTLRAARAVLTIVGIAAAGGMAWAAAPVVERADGPYLGTSPCADCAAIRVALTLYTDAAGTPMRYRMRTTYLGTRDGVRSEEQLGPWARVDERVRLEPYDAGAGRSYRRVDAETLVPLDRDERPIADAGALRLARDGSAVAGPAIDVPRTLFAGTLRQEGERLLLAACAGGPEQPVRDVSPEVMITAVLNDLGFGRRDRLYVEAFGRERDGELLFERLNRAGVEMRCPAVDERLGFRAQGNEPGWSLRGSPERTELLRLGMPAIAAPPLPLSWRWPDGRSDRARASIAVATEASRFTATLTPRICRDTMADAAYGFTAVVRLQRPEPAGELKGCGFLGTEALP
jgi:uncharacterized membrane protein